MTSLKVLLLLFALAFITKAYHGDHECTHDKENHPEAELHDVDEDTAILQDEGRLLASSYNNIRMVAYYATSDSAPSSFKSYILNKLAPSVLDWFQGALKVKYPVSGKLKVDSSSVCGVSTPSALRSGVNADYAIIFTSKSENSNTVATSKACTRASGTRRPLVANTLFNRNQIQATNDVLEHEKNVYLLIHEMMHTLAFSASHYPYFLDANGNTRKGHVKSAKLNGKTSTVIDVPPLTERLRKHFGCSSMPGLYMENDGGSGTAGSHFERKIFLYEHMCSGGIYGRRVSEFSLAMLEGSGWYVPNYDYAEPYFFGQGQGCGFISATSSSASKYDEFCTSSSRGCAPQGIAGGSCYSDSKTDGMKYHNPSKNYHCENVDAEDYARLPSAEVYGRTGGSKCFTGTLSTSSSSASSTSYCFKYTCSGSGSSTQLTVNIGSKSAVCKKEGKMSVSGYKGTINCPDPLTFCNTVGKKYCPRNCMNRGSCVNNKCVCRSGYTGIDCGLSS
jgi:leishmanolysin